MIYTTVPTNTWKQSKDYSLWLEFVAVEWIVLLFIPNFQVYLDKASQSISSFLFKHKGVSISNRASHEGF